MMTEDDYDDDDEDAFAERREFDEMSAHLNRQFSFDDAGSELDQVMEIRTHVRLDKIALFSGKRYRSDDALSWIKRFTFEMKGSRQPKDEWCEPFSFSLGKAAEGWYRQLPKKTQKKWSLLNDAFMEYYWSQYD